MPDDVKHPVAQPGHNRPPLVDFYREQNETLPGYLEAENADLMKRRDELLAAEARIPGTIENDETAGRVSDFIKQLGACAKAAEAKRTGDKEPTLQAGRIVDGFYKKSICDPLEAAKGRVSQRLTLYLRHKEEAERRRREEEERRAREAAEEARRQAAAAEAQMKTEADLAVATTAAEDAAQREADAIAARDAADAKAAELSRTRGDYGAVASLRTEWAFEITDRLALDLTALRPYLAADALDKALRGYIKAGGRMIAGARIFERKVAAVR